MKYLQNDVDNSNQLYFKGWMFIERLHNKLNMNLYTQLDSQVFISLNRQLWLTLLNTILIRLRWL